MIFPHRLDAVFCFYCATLRKKETLVSETNMEDAYSSSWKKAPQYFGEHQQTHCYKSEALYIPRYKDVAR